MFPRPRHRLVTVLFALCSLLFMQLAVAAYACPGQIERARAAAVMASADAPCAGEMGRVMDDAQPGLCHAHCLSAQQSLDKAQSPSPVVAAGAGFVLVLPAVVPAAPPPRPQAPLLARSSTPPLSVRHCCFRI